MSNKPTCLYLGRFQPFHKGHRKAVDFLKSLSVDLTIGLGSPRENNFFSLDERKRMILDNTGIEPIAIEDLDKNHPLSGDWGKYVLEVTGDKNLIATGNEIVKGDFQKENKYVLHFCKDYENISGTIIRNIIMQGGEEWRELVPGESIPIINRSNFYRRCQDERR